MFRIDVESAARAGSIDLRFYADPGIVPAMRAKLQAEGRIEAQSVRLVRADGERFEARISQELIEEADARYAISAIEDISVEHAAREALKASEQRFSSAFHFSPVGMSITRLANGTFLEVNDADRTTLGYAREDVLGRRSTETGSWLTLEDRQRFVGRLRAERSLAAYATKMRTKAGEVVDCLLWAAQVEINGEACVLSTTLNVSKQKREEALILEIARGVSGETGAPFFRLLVEHLGRALQGDMVIVGEILAFGRVRTLGVLRDGAMTADFDYNLEGTPCATLAQDTGITLYSDDVSVLFPQDDALAKGGFRGYIGVSLRDPAGNPIGVLNVICRNPIEPSERTEALLRIFAARAQAELLRLRGDREIRALNESLEMRVAERTAQLEAANRELEAFSYSVSHDLRAPLRAIDGFVRIFAGKPGTLDEALRAHALERVFAATKRMNELIEDLIGLARVSRQQLHLEQVDLSALARETGATLRERNPDRNVELLVSDGLAGRCDRALARIVLENLLGNAWKFTGRRAAARIEFGSEVLPDGTAALFVRDNGAGFDPQYAHRLFAPFQRLHSERDFEGTGIGLATVQRIAALHGGKAWATGEPDKGATFYLTLGLG